MPTVIGSVFNLNGVGRYVHWGWVQISWANLIVIGAMVLVFLLAITLPFPHGKRHTPPTQGPSSPESADAAATEQAAP